MPRNTTIGTPWFNNASRIARVSRRASVYMRLFLHARRCGVPVFDLLRVEFPTLLPDSKRPPVVTIELTNHCNVRCVYCLNPLALRPRGVMEHHTVLRVIEDIGTLRVPWLRLVGNGEPTIHPDFRGLLPRLAGAAKLLSLVTNAQWKDPGLAEAIVKAPVGLVDVSVDAGGQETYEASHVGASFDRLLTNLRQLRRERDRQRSRTMMRIRVNYRPSQKGVLRRSMAAWQRFADVVIPQPILMRKPLAAIGDLFVPVQVQRGQKPRCSLPFKDLGVNWNGDVPLCSLSASQIGAPGVLLGNVNVKTLGEMWNSELMDHYRTTHRGRESIRPEACLRCAGI